MFAVPLGVALEGALPVVLTAGFEDPVGPAVPGEAGGMVDPVGAVV